MEDPGDDGTLRLPLLGESSSEGGGGAGGGAAAGASLSATIFNVLNIYVGLGLLTMPYACMKGGWAALGFLLVLVPLFATSGQLICRAFDLLPASAPRSYPALGAAAAGRAGRRAVLLFCFLELAGASIVLLMVCWQMLELLLPSEGIGPLRPMHLAAGISTACLLPLLLIELAQLSRLSVLGSTSSLMVIALALALLGLDPSRQAMPQQPPPGRHAASIGVLQSIGIFALSCSAHTTLPALRSAMRKPSEFPAALSISFSVMLACYSSLAAAGYWYWGDSASPLVTTDLATNSFYVTRRVPVDRLLAVFVMVNCLSKYPALNLILQDMVLSILPLLRDSGGSFRPPKRRVALALRLVLFATCALLALTAYDALGSVLSLLGGLCSITCSLILPTAFYSLLAWPRLRTPARVALLALLALALSLAALITAQNICFMVPACRRWQQGEQPAVGSVAGLALRWAQP
ncbi:hypothetical protein ABPG75_002248 [Micractinium tetrahymenae]